MTGYGQDTSPPNNKSLSVNNKTSPALKYWENELKSKNNATKEIYLKNFEKFTDFIGKNADELLIQRQENQIDKDPKIQRLIESQLNNFMATKRETD